MTNNYGKIPFLMSRSHRNSLRCLFTASCLAILFLLPSCTKIHRAPSPPEVYGNQEVLRSLRDVQLRLERLRRQKEYAHDKMLEAEQALAEARELYRKGRYGQAYDMILKANARMNAAKAAALLQVGDKTTAELERELASISGHMSDMEFEVNMKMTMGQARKAIDYVDHKIADIKTHVDSLTDALREAENLLEFAKKHYQAGDYQKAFNLAVDAAEKAELVMPVEVLGREMASYSEAAAKKRSDTYRVKKKDCLWKIAAKRSVYGDPLLWPVLYKANTKLIRDPHLIQPGWKLQVPRGGELKRVAKKKMPKARKAATRAAKKKRGRSKKAGTPIPTPRSYTSETGAVTAPPAAEPTAAPLKVRVGSGVIVPTATPEPPALDIFAVEEATATPSPPQPRVVKPSAPPLPQAVHAPQKPAAPSAPPLPAAVSGTGDTAAPPSSPPLPTSVKVSPPSGGTEETGADAELEALLGSIGEDSGTSAESAPTLEDIMSELGDAEEEPEAPQLEAAPAADMEEAGESELDLEALLKQAAEIEGGGDTPEELPSDESPEEDISVDFDAF